MAKSPELGYRRRSQPYLGPARIVSGGQSGVDRAALDCAIELGLAHGGWCPAGRWAEDGPIDPGYRLRPAPARHVALRTHLNVRDSEGTLILLAGRARGGTRLTVLVARALGRPLLVLDPTAPNATRLARGFLARHGIARLNVAGPRASEAPAIHTATMTLLRRVLPRASGGRPRPSPYFSPCPRPQSTWAESIRKEKA